MVGCTDWSFWLKEVMSVSQFGGRRSGLADCVLLLCLLHVQVKPGWASWLPQWTDARAMRQVSTGRHYTGCPVSEPSP